MQNLDVKNSPLERGVAAKRTGCVTPLLRRVPASPLTKGVSAIRGRGMSLAGGVCHLPEGILELILKNSIK